MPVITFQRPTHFQQGNPHPFFQHNHFLGNGNDQLGIYIWGVKLNFNGVIKFCPIYVGEGWLRNQLQIDHYNGKTQYGAHTKELFDLNLLQENPNDFYTRILFRYNTHYMNYYANHAPHQNPMLIALNHDLVYFQSQKHMYLYCFNDIDRGNNLNHTHGQALNNYNAHADAGNVHSQNLALRFARSKTIIRENFYFIYVTLQSIRQSNPNDFIGVDDKELKKRVENSTKKALEKINIFTTGKGQGDNWQMDIDLTAIQNDLIIVNPEGFVNPNGQYPNEYGNVGNPNLIIPFP